MVALHTRSGVPVMRDLEELIGLFELASEHDGNTEITPVESREIVRILKSLQQQLPAGESNGD